MSGNSGYWIAATEESHLVVLIWNFKHAGLRAGEEVPHGQMWE